MCLLYIYIIHFLLRSLIVMENVIVNLILSFKNCVFKLRLLIPFMILRLLMTRVDFNKHLSSLTRSYLPGLLYNTVHNFVYEQKLVCWKYFFYFNDFRADTLNNFVIKVWFVKYSLFHWYMHTTIQLKHRFHMQKKVWNHALQTEKMNKVQNSLFLISPLRVFFFLIQNKTFLIRLE